MSSLECGFRDLRCSGAAIKCTFVVLTVFPMTHISFLSWRGASDEEVVDRIWIDDRLHCLKFLQVLCCKVGFFNWWFLYFSGQWFHLRNKIFAAHYKTTFVKNFWALEIRWWSGGWLYKFTDHDYNVSVTRAWNLWIDNQATLRSPSKQGACVLYFHCKR